MRRMRWVALWHRMAGAAARGPSARAAQARGVVRATACMRELGSVDRRLVGYSPVLRFNLQIINTFLFRSTVFAILYRYFTKV